jgi:hypothetical protein
MKNIISIFLLFSCFLVKATTISVVTYNVNYHFINKDIVNILDSIDADIVCLQETNAEWETIIKNGLSRKYPFIDSLSIPLLKMNTLKTKLVGFLLGQ